MPEEKSGGQIEQKPDAKPLMQSPRNSGGGQGSPPSAVENNSNQNANPSAQIDRDIRSGERWLIGIGIASVFINTVIALIYLGQLNQMRRVTEINSGTLGEAENALDISQGQFDRSMRQIINQSGIQLRAAKASEKSAIAATGAADTARDAADIAKQTLIISQRAYISNDGPNIDWRKSAIYFVLVNKGHIPSGPVHLILHVGKTTKTPDGGMYTDYKWIERRMDKIDPGVSISFGGVGFDADKLKNGSQWFHLGLVIEYNDGFPPQTAITTDREAFCGDYSPQTGPIIGPCLISNALELLEKADKYPSPVNQIIR